MCEMKWGGWKGDLFSKGFRINTGGYMYGACPYKYLRIGPIMLKKYYV